MPFTALQRTNCAFVYRVYFVTGPVMPFTALQRKVSAIIVVETFLILVFAYRMKKILEIPSCLIVLFYNTDKEK